MHLGKESSFVLPEAPVVGKGKEIERPARGIPFELCRFVHGVTALLVEFEHCAAENTAVSLDSGNDESAEKRSNPGSHRIASPQRHRVAHAEYHAPIHSDQ